jgi:pyruvate dehydrogenase E2 component (dihydrolipoamide acetyltransferase)
MAIPITIPRLGWNMDEGVFVGWLKADGEEIRPGEPLFTLEGEKATQDIESLDQGILRISADEPQAGDKLAVGAVIGYLVQAGEIAPALSPSQRKPSPGSLAKTAGAGAAPGHIVEQDRRQRAAGYPTISPRALRLAQEFGIDWTQLRGSGRTGRIRECDVRAAVGAGGAAISGRTVASLEKISPLGVLPIPHGKAVAVSPIRKTIAERLLTSVRSTAPVTLTTAVNATALVGLRQQLKAAAQAKNEAVPTYTDFFVKLSAAGLQGHPLLNACWVEDQIVVPDGIHIGFAVDTDAGLLVPVIRDVPALSLAELAARSIDLAARARQRKLAAEEMQGGTFTVTNLGPFGVDAFTPIINFPQCAVLGVGRIERRPVVVDDQLAARDQVTLSLTFDHRIVDGAPAARFLQSLGQLIENPRLCLKP